MIMYEWAEREADSSLPLKAVQPIWPYLFTAEHV